MLQGDAASPIRPPCSDSSCLTVETRGVRNHPDPVNGASGPAPSNAPQPSTAAASSCAATGARRLEAFRAHEDTRRQRLPTVRAGVRRSSRLTAGRWARRRCWRVRVRVRRPRVRRPAASVRTLEPSRPRPSASLREYVWLACFHCAPAPAAPPRLPTLLRSNTLNFSGRPSKFGSERSGVGPEFEKGDGRLRPSLQQRLPGAEGPPKGCTTDPRHAACGGPLPSSAELRFLFSTFAKI